MIKRPVDKRFTGLVREGRKTTTIREKPWPLWTPIMLYNWSGIAYRSKQSDVAAVIVSRVTPITITHHKSGEMSYEYKCHGEARPIWQTEGFNSGLEMDEWFRRLVKPGQSIERPLMTFRLQSEIS